MIFSAAAAAAVAAAEKAAAAAAAAPAATATAAAACRGRDDAATEAHSPRQDEWMTAWQSLQSQIGFV